MITFDRDLCFLDTETLGLDRNAPVWEFAAVRVQDKEILAIEEFLIGHEPGDWLDTLPEKFASDYRARYNADRAIHPVAAAAKIAAITADAIIVGSNPSFDAERLELLLRANGFEPGWWFHPLDIPSMVAGQVARSVVAASAELGDEVRLAMVWGSNPLSRRLGVDPDTFARHTAMGDVQWCLTQWQAMNGQVAQ